MTLDLPLVVCGEVDDDLSEGAVTFEYAPDVAVRMPRLRDHHVEAVVASRDQVVGELAELSTFEVTSFLSKVGQTWLDRTAPSYRTLVRELPPIVGYAPEMVASDAYMMAEYLRFRTYLYDQIESELGHELILDEWVPVQASYVRAFPVGTALHWLVGNIPIASVYSMVRSLAMRNQTIAKLPSRDPVSATCFALALREVDPGHPVTRAVSTIYWPHDDTEIDRPLFGIADVVCSWGGGAAIEAVRRRAGASTRLVELGPRWSAAAIDLDDVADDELPAVAARLASDICYYDQEACLSAQQLFVVGDWERLRGPLEAALDAFAGRMPITTTSIDIHAHVESCTREWLYRGADVTDGGAWRTVVTDDPIPEHPLNRTIFVRRVGHLRDAATTFDRSLQTVAVHPWARSVELRDLYSQRGADRIVELGFTRHVRHGYTHDGMRTLNALVRLVSHERPGRGRHFYKYGDPTVEGVEQLLFVMADGSDDPPRG